MRQLLRNFVQSSATITVIRGETRGQNFLNGTAGQGGPDAHIQDGDNEFLDASGINGAGLGHQLRAHRLTKPAQDQDKIILAAAEQEGTRLDHKPNLNSIEYREHEKHNGTDAKEIRRNHQKFTPLVFSPGAYRPNSPSCCTEHTANNTSPRTNPNGNMTMKTKSEALHASSQPPPPTRPRHT